MKRIRKIFVCIMSLIILSGAFVGCGSKPTPTPERDKNLIFSFESFKDVYSTIKNTYNRLGKWGVSDEHVTEGSKSLKMEVIGEYNGKRPGFDITCRNSACLTNNIFNYEYLALDVFNANDKDLQLGISFGVDNVGKTPLQKFDLPKKESTTCEYKIPELADYCDYTDINFIHLEFFEHKTSAEDSLNVYYFDNLRGIELTKPRELSEDAKIPSFEDGFTFEGEKQGLIEVVYMKVFNDFETEWISYKERNIDTPKNYNLGENGLLCKNPTKNDYPSFLLELDEKYPKGTTFSFWTYFEVNENLIRQDDDKIRIEAFADTAKTGGAHSCSVTKSSFAYNKWIYVTFTTNSASDRIWLFYNLISDKTRLHVSEDDYSIYIDNFIVVPPEQSK